MKSCQRSSKFECRGVALVICLLIIVLISVLLVGFVTTARLETSSSQSYAGSIEANLFAQMGIDTAVAKLKTATDRSGHWISQPGGLIVKPLNGDGAKYVDLSSGKMPSVEEDISVNLNPAALTEPSGLIVTDSNVAFPVQWIYITKQGDILDALPAYTPGNSVIGRYAFWTDDNSARLNWNTAWTKLGPNTTAPNHPSQIDLTAAPGIELENATAIRDYRTSHSLFNTPESIREMNDADLDEVVRLDKFAFTHFNHSPNLNLFGEARIALTTKATRAGPGATYLNILSDESVDSGSVANVDLSKLNTVFKTLCGLLNRKDWPVELGEISFYDKYGEEQCVQIALGIIEYVRSVESAYAIVEPLQVTVTGTVKDGTIVISALAPSSSASWQYLGNTRGPRITEMGIHVPNNPGGDGKYACSLIVEVFNPPGSGTKMNLSDLKLYYSTRPTYPFGNANFTSTTAVITAGMIYNASSVTDPLELGPGEVRLLKVTVPVDKDSENRTPPKKFFLKVGLFSVATNKMIEFIPYTYTPHIQYDATPGVAELAIETYSVEDPLVNRSMKNWLKTTTNTFGAIPVVGFDSSIAPQQDSNDAGSDVDAVSVWRSSGPKAGTVNSVAELGFIHTGLGSSAVAGIPWRTLRLQPRKASDRTLPDWLLMDCFYVPVVAGTPREAVVVTPSPLSFGGRLNINGAMSAFDEETPITARDFVPQAWLKGIPGISDTVASEIANHLTHQTLADRGGNVGRIAEPSAFSEKKTYITAGAITEISGVADQGEASEANVRNLIDLADTRGNVFSIYGIGQSVLQTETKVVVQGEKRTLTVIERRDDGGIRTVFTKELGL